MFENVIHQNAVKDMSHSLADGSLPNTMLFWGEKTSGKLTTALELARVLSCEKRIPRGAWDCSCPSCLRHKQLVSQDVLLAGNRDCTNEIEAAQKTLLDAHSQNASYMQAACYFFVRSVRKLTMRFSPAVIENAEAQKISKIADLISDIEEYLEEIDPANFTAQWNIDSAEKLKKTTSSIISLCKKLDSEFMYTTLPVSYVRSISAWARWTVKTGKKTVIIENAENLNESARNALLKILEEPPENIVFVLTTTNRQMIMPTILSRVRTYRFARRTREQQLDVLKRVFHAPQEAAADDSPASADAPNAILTYLNSFLPVNPDEVFKLGSDFLLAAISGKTPDTKKIAAAANNFSPRQLMASFFDGMIFRLKQITHAQESANDRERAVNFSAQCMAHIRNAKTRITLANQNPANALDLLRQDIAAR